MTETLYLDTARIGRMSPSAADACQAATALANIDPHLLGSVGFLRDGVSSWTEPTRANAQGLNTWEGIAGLKLNLKTLVGADADHSVIVSSRSGELMKLAARMLFRLSRNVLVVDACWPNYVSLLQKQQKASHNRITYCNVRESVYRDKATAADVTSMVRKAYLENHCDGIFLPSVSNDGIRLPVKRIMESLEADDRIRFSVVDGAQELGHLPTELASNYCDFYVAGSHKWLGSHLPLGIGFFAKERSRRLIEATFRRLIDCGEIEDPLTRYVHSIETGRAESLGETVNLSPLFACNGAASDARDCVEASRECQRANAQKIELATSDSAWSSVGKAADLSSGILMLHGRSKALNSLDPACVESGFRQRGVTLTAYNDGQIRISLPKQHLTSEDTHRLCEAFSTVGNQPVSVRYIITLCVIVALTSDDGVDASGLSRLVSGSTPLPTQAVSKSDLPTTFGGVGDCRRTVRPDAVRETHRAM